MNFLKTVFTGKDNQSGDIGRIIWAFSTVALVFHEGWATIVAHQHFDAVSFATACGGLMAAGAAALGLKAKTEPGS